MASMSGWHRGALKCRDLRGAVLSLSHRAVLQHWGHHTQLLLPQHVATPPGSLPCSRSIKVAIKYFPFSKQCRVGFPESLHVLPSGVSLEQLSCCWLQLKYHNCQRGLLLLQPPPCMHTSGGKCHQSAGAGERCPARSATLDAFF